MAIKKVSSDGAWARPKRRKRGPKPHDAIWPDKKLPPKVKVVGKKRGEMNGFEWQFYEYLTVLRLDGKLIDVQYESHKYRLADGTWYTPDFYCIGPDNERLIYETKGFRKNIRDGLLRLKVVASLYPYDKFLKVTRPAGCVSWQIDLVTASPIRP